MKYTYPFDIATGTEGTGASDWADANLGNGFEGSIPPAVFYSRTQREIITAIEESGQTPSNADLGQLSKAIVLNHRLVENRTIYVPGDFDTVPEALSYLSARIIPDDVFVTILAGAGDIEIDQTTGPLLLDQPYGSRIRIQGQPLTGTGFPAPNEVNVANKNAVEATIRARFPTRLVIAGGVKGIFMKSGMFSRISRLAIIGDGSANQDGICIGEWQGDIGTGNIRLQDVYVFNCGTNGIRSNYAAAIQGNNVGASHCGTGYNSANSSAIQIGGTVLGIRNGQGAQIRDQGFMELIQGAVAAFTNNTGNGIWSNETGSFQALNAASLDIRNNGGAGVATSFQSYSYIPNATTGGGNGSGDIVTSGMSTGRIPPGASGLSISPALGQVGNSNSINILS